MRREKHTHPTWTPRYHNFCRTATQARTILRSAIEEGDGEEKSEDDTRGRKRKSIPSTAQASHLKTMRRGMELWGTVTSCAPLEQTHDGGSMSTVAAKAHIAARRAQRADTEEEV